MKKKHLISLVILLLSANNVFGAHLLPEFNATYAVQKFNVKVAEARYQLSHTENGYIFTQNTHLYGLASLFGNDTLSVTSYIQQTANNLYLEQHSYIQTGRKNNKNENFKIKWQKSLANISGKITGIARGKKINVNINQPVWDVLSFQLPLMLVANEKTKNYHYLALLNGKLEAYNFNLIAIEKLSFGNKNYQAIHIAHTNKNKNRQLHLWLLPALQNFPVQIEVYRDGKLNSNMVLEQIQFNNSPANIFATNDDKDNED